jgi:manganese/zinc/iron transport system substrate-binding protein
MVGARGRSGLRWSAGTAGLLLLAAAACAPPAPADTDGRLYAVATVGMVADVVRNVGGERVRVDALMGPGVDPHLYKASEGDVRRLFRADVVFYVGLHLEARMAEVLDEMGARVRTVAVGQAVPVEQLQRPPEFAGAYDPHVWFDVALWRHTVGAVARALADADPVHAAEYHANAERYTAQLDTLDGYVRARAAELPPARRVLITAHDAFNYFGRAYGFEVHGLQGISTAAEAGTHDVQVLAASSPSAASRRVRGVVRPPPHHRGGAGGGAGAGLHRPRSAGTCSPTRWGAPARRKGRTSAWSGTTWTRSSTRSHATRRMDRCTTERSPSRSTT